MLAFYPWLVLHFLFFSNDSANQLHELSSTWLRCLLATFTGIALGLMLRGWSVCKHEELVSSNRQKYIDSILLTGFSSVFIIFFCSTAYLTIFQDLITENNFFVYPYKSKAPFVIGSAIFSTACFAIILNGIFKPTRLFSAALATLGIFLVIFANFFSNTKNGMLVFGFSFFEFLVFLYIQTISKKISRNSILNIALICLIISISAVGISQHIKNNAAWINIIADIRLSLNTGDQNWIQFDKTKPPVNELGNNVNESTYQRITWFVAGLHLLNKNPLGYGLLHHSFGALAHKEWPKFQAPVGNMRGATHSGWLDIALGLGLPGIALILIPLSVAWYRSIHEQDFWSVYVSLSVPAVFLAYLVAELAGGHSTEILFFYIALVSGITISVPTTFKAIS
jgi:hypothetical protein